MIAVGKLLESTVLVTALGSPTTRLTSKDVRPCVDLFTFTSVNNEQIYFQNIHYVYEISAIVALL